MHTGNDPVVDLEAVVIVSNAVQGRPKNAHFDGGMDVDFAVVILQNGSVVRGLSKMEELGIGARGPAAAADPTGRRDVVDEGRVGVGIGTGIAGSGQAGVEQ